MRADKSAPREPLDSERGRKGLPGPSPQMGLGSIPMIRGISWWSKSAKSVFLLFRGLFAPRPPSAFFVARQAATEQKTHVWGVGRILFLPRAAGAGRPLRAGRPLGAGRPLRRETP